MDGKFLCTATIKFEEVSLPPFRDVFILAKMCPHGKHGISGCLTLLSPDEFELIEINNEHIEAIVVNKKLLNKLPVEKIIKLLEQQVFPYVHKGEMVKVDIDLKFIAKDIPINLGG